MTKKVLIALVHGGLSSVAEFPHMLEQAGLEVTIIASPRFKCCIGRGYRHWIPSTENADDVIADIAKIFMADDHAYDWVILSQDELLRALHNSPISTSLKTQIGPIGNANHLSTLGSKCNAAEFCLRHDILVPSFKNCTTLKEIEEAATSIGFPVMVKIDHSVSGDGSFKCNNVQDIVLASAKFRGEHFLVEKFVEGPHIRLDPLFLNGELIACSASTVLETVCDGFGVATRRKPQDAAPYEATLRKLGAALQLNGFLSLGLMRDNATGEIYLFEIDCRPNPWPPYGKHIGADFTAAIKNYFSNPSFTSRPFLSVDTDTMVSILWRDIPYSMRRGKVMNLMDWLTNRNQLWRMIPFHDPRLLCYWWVQITHKGFGFLLRKLSRATP